MKNGTTTILLFFVGIASSAQEPRLPLQKLQEKNLLPHLSYIPSKSFTSLAYTGSDSVSFYIPRTATASGFYISQTEVTNKEYREFVVYARDSMAHTLLKHFKKGGTQLDWNKKIDWKNELLEPMMLSPDERIFGRREISADKIKYNVDLFGERKSLSIYPDTLVWIRDFAYSYNEPLAKRYFSHPFYNNYPVLGINIEQAIAFCQWKTEQINKSLKKAGAAYEVIVRLPTNTEWESAAIGEKDTLSLFSRNHSYGINFGTITDKNGYRVKGYDEDSFFYTSPVKSFPVGDYGLYDMRGNLAEWTTTKASDIINDIQKNNEMLEHIKDYYVVKGGGWDSEPFYLQTGTCRFFGAGAAHSFVGFRYVVFIGVKK